MGKWLPLPYFYAKGPQSTLQDEIEISLIEKLLLTLQ